MARRVLSNVVCTPTKMKSIQHFSILEISFWSLFSLVFPTPRNTHYSDFCPQRRFALPARGLPLSGTTRAILLCVVSLDFGRVLGLTPVAVAPGPFLLYHHNCLSNLFLIHIWVAPTPWAIMSKAAMNLCYSLLVDKFFIY